jgi:hypothetical protein
MTISQSRFGGNAEVGRNSDWKDRSRGSGSSGVLAGLGVMAGGGGALAASRSAKQDANFHRTQVQRKKDSFRTANAERRGAKLDARAARLNEEAFSIWHSGPKPKNVIPLAAVGGKPAGKLQPKDWDRAFAHRTLGANFARERMLRETAHVQARNKTLDQAKDILTHRAGEQKMVARGRSLSRLGRAGIAGGALVAGGSLFANEAMRGTIGAKRSRTISAQAPSASMERHRRLNGM